MLADHSSAWEVTGPGGRVGMSRLLDSLHLGIKFLDPREGVSRSNAVDQDEALAVPNPLVSEGGVFLLTGSVSTSSMHAC